MNKQNKQRNKRREEIKEILKILEGTIKLYQEELAELDAGKVENEKYMGTGEKIRSIRKCQGLTQKELGIRSGIAEPTIRRYELGKLNPKLSTIKKIAKALNVEVESLIDLKEERDIPEQVEIQHVGYDADQLGRNK